MANKPYTYPTPEMLDLYRRSLNGTPGGTVTTINPSNMGAPTAQGGAISRIRNWLGIRILGADAGDVLFPPQQPLQPIAQTPEQYAVGRPWDYPVGYNTRVTPRDGNPVCFETLKNLAVGYDVIAIIMQRVKDKISSQKWTIGPRDEKAPRDKQMDDLEAFFEYPDKTHNFTEWLKMLMDQVMVYDAPAIWLRPTLGGDLYSLEILDGSKITPKIGPDGRIPEAMFGPGYQQVLKGLPAVDYVRPLPMGVKPPVDPQGYPFPELLYRPKNPRVDSLYGYSPVEQIITTINIALRREAYLLSYYTDGSTPDLMLSVPKEWNPDQISKFQNWWDSVLSGNLSNRRGTRFVPDGAKLIDTKEKALTDMTDEWLIKICCYAFGVSPVAFTKAVNKGQEKMHHDEAAQEGAEPWLEWVADLMNLIIRTKFGRNDVLFRWREDEATSEADRAQIDVALVNAKIYHPDEIRQRRGDVPMPAEMRGQMDMATFAATANATILPPDQQATADAQSLAMQAAKPAPIQQAPAEKPTTKTVYAVKRKDGSYKAVIK